MCRFGALGELERWTPDSPKEIQIEKLNPSIPIWRHDRTASPIPRIADPWNLRVVSSDSGVVAQREADGEVRAYRIKTGERVDDSWLTSVITDACGRLDLGNHRLWLTSDLKYLLLSPTPEWAGPDTKLPMAKRPRIREFAMRDNTYSRSNCGIYYARPSLAPQVFEKTANAKDAATVMPYDAYSVDGELLLLEVALDGLRLRRTDGSVSSQVTGTLPFNDLSPVLPRKRIDAENHRIVLWCDGGEDARFVRTYKLAICIWRFNEEVAQKALSVYRVDLSEVFTVTSGEYVPIHSLVVQKK
jgi:hypothetical protein